jgi:hypothetical protein
MSSTTKKLANSARKPSSPVDQDTHAPQPCKLCGQVRELRDSHIIPEFCYAAMYPPKPALHRFHYMHDVDAGKVKWEQQGFKEYLLCEQCEQKLGVWENYATRLFRTELPQPASGQTKPILFYGLDYAHLKLFFLSVLWRASVSTHTFYEHVRLGPHEDKIRDMLFRGIPGDPTDYGCIVSLLLDRGQPLRNVLVEPIPLQIQGQDFYRFVFGGFVLDYFLSARNLPLAFREHMFKSDGTDGTLTIEQLEHDNSPVLRDLRKRAAESLRSPY